jgi:hypothetical protein
MNPVKWLCARAPGFAALQQEERDAIMHFALLWSLFEGTVLGTHASAASIIDVSSRWEVEGRLQAAAFDECLAYFRYRHFQGNEFTHHFAGLRFRRNDHQELVEAVLKGERQGVGDTAAALLIIVYRLRNNLFHGVKWADELRGQLENFRNANTLLILGLDHSG